MAFRVTRLFAQVAVSASGLPVNQTMLSQSLSQTGDAVFYVTQNFLSTNDAVADPVYNIPVGQSFLTQSLGSFYNAVSHSMFAGASSNNASPDTIVPVTQYLGFTDRRILDVGNYIGFSGTTGPATIVNVSNHFFTNPVKDNLAELWATATVSFGFTATAVIEGQALVRQDLNLSNSITNTGSTFSRPVEPGMGLKQSVSIVVDDTACKEKEYAPFLGSSDDETYHEFTVAAPALVPSAGTITLKYPVTSPTHTITLQNPNFGNEDKLSFTRIDRPTRGGDRKIFSDADWAQWERLTFTSNGNNETCESTFDAVLSFLNASLAKEIELTDWEGREWTGVIVAPETDISRTQTGYSLQLVFEGRVSELAVQHGIDTVIHGQDSNGDDVSVTYG